MVAGGDRVALVTGAASGIGRATAMRLAADGIAVIIADIQDEAGDELVAEIKREGGTASYVRLDDSNESSWSQAVAETLRDHNHLDILINNAGIGDTDPIEQTTLETYERVVAVTQTSVFSG